MTSKKYTNFNTINRLFFLRYLRNIVLLLCVLLLVSAASQRLAGLCWPIFLFCFCWLFIDLPALTMRPSLSWLKENLFIFDLVLKLLIGFTYPNYKKSLHVEPQLTCFIDCIWMIGFHEYLYGLLKSFEKKNYVWAFKMFPINQALWKSLFFVCTFNIWWNNASNLL